MKKLLAWFWSKPWAPFVAWGAGGFVLAYLIVAIFVFPAGAALTDQSVPNVIGISFADAQRQLQSSGFTAERGEARFHNAAPKGTVLDQQPEAGSDAPPGSRITLAVSAGPKLGTVPSVIGMSREQALTALEVAGFEANEVSERASNEPRGAVIDSKPRPGAQVAVPSPVLLVISAGPTTVVVPDVVGRPLSDATQFLRQVGLTIGDVRGPGGLTPEPSATVLSQSPAAGREVPAGTRVDMIVGGRP